MVKVDICSLNVTSKHHYNVIVNSSFRTGQFMDSLRTSYCLLGRSSELLTVNAMPYRQT